MRAADLKSARLASTMLGQEWDRMASTPWGACGSGEMCDELAIIHVRWWSSVGAGRCRPAR